MSEPSTFDSLVRGLSREERRDLLTRIRGTAEVSDEPMFRPETVREPPVDYSAQYRELGPLARLVILVRRLFSGKPRDELVKELLLRHLARRIELGSPGLVSYSRRVFLNRMLAELRDLRDGARYIYDLLDRSVEKDRGAFYAFLASLELEEQHQRLLSETDPFLFAQTNSLAGEPEVRTAVWTAFDGILSSMPEESRRRMYADVRSLAFLKRVAGFLYDRLFSCFEGAGGAAPESPFVTARDLMSELADILYSMASPPSLKLMESLLVFQMREEMENPDFDAETALKTQLARVEEALARIRSFNARVPLHEILRVVMEDPNYRPRELAGGEDWFAIYKGFWKERIEKQLSLYGTARRMQDLQSDIAGFLGSSEPVRFEYINEEGREGSPPVRLEKALGFLSAFYERLFVPEMNRTLKILLIEGEFYKKDNRVEYTDAYNELLQIPEALSGLDARLGPGGDLGSAWVQAKEELVSLPLKRRKVQAALQAANGEAEALLSRSREAMKRMQAILKGLLKGEAGGRYDSLSNLSYIEGKGNKEFLRNLDSIKNRLERTVHFLDELEKLGMTREPA
ncbi:MAG TPA: DUF5312 family protein [Spirochaetia bacterium]|nr:DUF5312 family protein [Spirochaetales bacterium]HRY81595.1 DUF5312 family protein [Spirochaetia bacterium]